MADRCVPHMCSRMDAALLVAQLRRANVPMIMTYAALLLSFNTKISLMQDRHFDKLVFGSIFYFRLHAKHETENALL